MLLNIITESQKHTLIVISAAETVRQKFKGILEAFATCHGIYNGNVLKEEAIQQIGNVKYG